MVQVVPLAPILERSGPWRLTTTEAKCVIFRSTIPKVHDITGITPHLAVAFDISVVWCAPVRPSRSPVEVGPLRGSYGRLVTGVAALDDARARVYEGVGDSRKCGNRRFDAIGAPAMSNSDVYQPESRIYDTNRAALGPGVCGSEFVDPRTLSEASTRSPDSRRGEGTMRRLVLAATSSDPAHMW